MNDQPYHVAMSFEGEGARFYEVRWRGKIDPVATCTENRDAVRICDALNNSPRVSCGPAINAWTPVAQELPGEDIQVLVLTIHGHLHVAYLQEGRWKIRDLPPGTQLSKSAITHWCLPCYPDKTMNEMITIPRELLESLLDGEDCDYDHHGGCQAHGYLTLEKGQRCPQEEARELLALSKPNVTGEPEGATNG
jgi:hypothetical protein